MAEPLQKTESSGRPVPPLVWLAAGIGYASITTISFLASGRESAARAVATGLLNALPEALAAPFAWRWATAPRQRSEECRNVPRTLLFGALFGIWCAAASSFAFNLWLRIEKPGSPWRFEPGISIWRFAMGALVFAALVGAGTAIRRGREAAAAIRAAERAEAVRARAELATLRSQLQPHFLFNVLHSLIGIVHRDPKRAERMLERLGDLVRDALRLHAEARDEIALEEEIALTRRYLEIEGLRLGERLAVEWRVETLDLQHRVPPFALQSLVENAVRHSVAPRSEGGTIVIAAAEENGALALRVDDDGDGSPHATDGTGRGLELLRERLALLHGAAASISAAPKPGGGFRAELRVPRHAADGGDA